MCVCEVKKAKRGGRRHPAVPEMALFGNKLSSYAITQLSELLEDDEKLNKIVLDLEEVRVRVCFCLFFKTCISLRCDFGKRV